MLNILLEKSHKNLNNVNLLRKTEAIIMATVHFSPSNTTVRSFSLLISLSFYLSFSCSHHDYAYKKQAYTV